MVLAHIPLFLSLALSATVVSAGPFEFTLRRDSAADGRKALRENESNDITSNATRRELQHLQKRFDGRFTFYDVGLGACGGTNTRGEFVVALNANQYGSGQHCYEHITISCNGKTTSAQIVDMCPGCGFGDLDLSRGLFDFFGSEDVGVFHGSWDFGGAPPPPPKPKPSPPPPPPPKPKASNPAPAPPADVTTKQTAKAQVTSSTSLSTPPSTPTPPPSDPNVSVNSPAPSDVVPAAKAVGATSNALVNQVNIALLGLSGLIVVQLFH